jgi:hypothetical protein
VLLNLEASYIVLLDLPPATHPIVFEIVRVMDFRVMNDGLVASMEISLK